MEKIENKQKSVHTNTDIATYNYSQVYGNHTNNHTDYGKYGDWADWGDGSWTDSGIWHSNAYKRAPGYQYSKSGYNQGTQHTNYTQLTGYTQTNTVNRSPKITGTVGNTGVYGKTNYISINATLTYSDTENNARSKTRIYYAYSSNGSSWGNWTLLVEQTATTYRWNISNANTYPNGYYKIAVTVYDGNSWSALPSGTTFVVNHIEKGQTATNAYNNDISWAYSAPFRIVHYTPPTWLGEIYSAQRFNQVESEIGKARTAFGLGSYTFATTNAVSNLTIINASDLNQFKTASNAVYSNSTGSNYSFSHTPAKNAEIKNAAITQIQTLLEKVNKGD